MAKVVIGVDPHKRINAVVVLNSRGKVLARAQFMNDTHGFRELRKFSRQWRPRTWAIEGCNGVGKHVAQRLVAAGERVARTTTPTRTRSRWSVCTRRICRRCGPTTGAPRCGCCRTVAENLSGNGRSV